LPGSEPNVFFTTVDGENNIEHTVGENIPYFDGKQAPAWV